MRIAVIDLGTNTFNLIIAEKQKLGLSILFCCKESVKLGQGGISNNYIQADAFERAFLALQKFRDIIHSYSIGETVAIGTSALRTAINATTLFEGFEKIFGQKITVISGEREAELIYQGVQLSIPKKLSNYLILDIGGGSNEFIIVVEKQMVWKQSFPLGMARLIERFKPSDPITSTEVQYLESYFEQELLELFQQLKFYTVKCLVGAEGAFESFYNTIQYQKNKDYNPIQLFEIQNIEVDDYYRFHTQILQSSAIQRAKMKGIEPYRIEMLVLASIFVHFIVKKLQLTSIFMSPFSLKEGVVWEKIFK